MLFRLLLVFFLWYQAPYVLGQKPIFQKGDRVCFVGNSITNNGEFHHNILLYYVTRFPNEPLHFFNCGISGDVISGIFNRLNDDILVHTPTHVVIMIGMNDVNRGLYSEKPTTNADTLQRRAAALEKYRIGLDSLVRVFLRNNIRVILQKPSIYDQTAVLQTPNNWGVNDALKECADYIESLSLKYELDVVDYWQILSQLNKQLQSQNPSATIIGNDRVHPTATGHLVMAYQFLKTTQVPPQNFAQIVCSKNAKYSKKKSQYCAITTVEIKRDFKRLMVQEYALPYPTTDEQKEALALVPLEEAFNYRYFKVEKLKKGFYTFKIDTTVVGVFSHIDLRKGVNLSTQRYIPQYQQALAVKKALLERHKTEANLRTIKFVEYGFLKDFKNKNDLEAVKKYLDELYAAKLSHNIYFKNQFDKYIAIKPHEERLRLKVNAELLQAYELAQPKKHLFVVEKIISK
ncbi:SGNH/GDSL hydrolase family protein [Runella zeae]|uniref:SGNH/GDSL hydrolase family protein n=1 Tax=Runella zeae TaxID=94255 RepID=UPI00040D39F6|nr:SGNH/GDSL hydrolase family protein [Runella zeae]